MVRPCFLVVDQEHAGSISSRKLVLETAKFNVITAYSCEEALETLQLFPNVHGVVINGMMPDDDCAAFFTVVADRHPKAVRVLVGHCEFDNCPYDYFVEGFSPAKLLQTMRTAFPQETAAIEQAENVLEQKGQ